MDIKLRHFTEVGWTAGGQVATAIATVLGVRLLTEFVSPATFGVVTLTLGIALLALNTVCIPLTQALVRFYPELAASGDVLRLQRALGLSLRRVALWALAPVAIVALVCLAYYPDSFVLVVLVAMLFACDCARSVDLAFLNAARRHHRYALWVTGDAALRPVAASVAVVWFGESATVVLTGYILVSITLQLVFGTRLGLREQTPATLEPPRAIEIAGTEARLWQYALPLIPLGFLAWMNGLADRYIIGGTLSVADAGVYAAAYGLASRPFLSLGQAIELAVRPAYQNAVSAGNRLRAHALFARWLAVICGAGGAGVLVIAIWRNELTSLLLAAPFRQAAALMPWIAGGYALRVLADVFTRVCYAHGRTVLVFLPVLCGSLVGLAATVVGARYWGLTGAAISVPVYFIVQLGASVLAAQATDKRAAAEPRRVQWPA